MTKKKAGIAPGLSHFLSFVMPGLVPGIHVFSYQSKSWMAGSSPAMTISDRYFASARLGGVAGHDLISVS